MQATRTDTVKGKMINAIIVDDIEKAIIVLRRQLAAHCPEVNVVAQAEGVDDAILLIERYRPQLVFLDVEMAGKNGFELLEKIKERKFHVIFVTAHSEFAIRAFRFSVTDYLLKPVNSEELKHAVQKVLRIEESSDSDNNKGEKHPVTLRISSTKGVAFVKVNDIVRLEAEGHYTHIYMVKSGHYFSSYHLQQFEEYLSPNNFIRAHRSHLINRSRIKSLIQGQTLIVEMEDGAHIEIPRRNKMKFLSELQTRE